MDENVGLLKSLLQSFSRQEGLNDLLAMAEHPNGFKRENAVRRLGVLGNPLAIPKLLVRINDWVPQVRSAAREALQRLMKNENAQAFVYSLPALHRLRGCGRADHGELIAKVNQFLLRPENGAQIRAAVNNEDPYIARIALKLCIENSLDDKATLVADCLSHRDVVVRDLAADLLRDLNGEALESLLQKAIHDPFMPVRREAFQIYLRKFPETGLRMAQQLLFDRHIAIRDIAIAQLVRSGVNVESIFASVLESSGQSARRMSCALLGVANLRAKTLLPLVRRFTNHRLPSLRKASLQALTRLSEEEAKAYLLVGMADEAPSVAKESVRLLYKATQKPTLSELLQVVSDASPRHTLDACLGCARSLNKWDRLIFILSLCPRFSDEDDTRTCLDGALRRWDSDFNRTSSQPTRAQIEKITELYQQSKNIFSAGRHRSIEFTVRGL